MYDFLIINSQTILALEVSLVKAKPTILFGINVNKKRIKIKMY